MDKGKKTTLLMAKMVGVLILLTGLMLTPFFFEKFLAIGTLLSHEIILLKRWAGFLILLGILLISFRKKVGSQPAMIILSICILVYSELGFRFIAKTGFNNERKLELEKQGLTTYPEYMVFEGHPFLNFTKRAHRDVKDNNYKNLYPFNKQGFRDIDHTYNKPDSVYRIAALGGSTTEKGYPKKLNAILNHEWGIDKQISTMNFGLSNWTSAHTMVNFLLNVVEYDPDLIIIHHGWNEWAVRNTPPELFRPDYSHVLTYYHEPERFDAVIVRVSLIYRFIKYWYYEISQNREIKADLFSAVTKTDRELRNKNKMDYSDLSELQPYKRNITTIIDHALLKGIQVVLTTMPRTTDTTMVYYEQYPNIDQCNDISRQIAAEYDNRIIFVDLDSLMTGKADSLFVDLAHMSEQGRWVKARHIANTIMEYTQTAHEFSRPRNK